MAFSFVAGIFHCAYGMVEQAVMTRFHPNFYDLVSSIMGYKNSKMMDNVRIGEPRRHVKELKRLLKATLDENFEIGQNTQKFHLLDHVVDDLELFGCL